MEWGKKFVVVVCNKNLNDDEHVPVFQLLIFSTDDYVEISKRFFEKLQSITDKKSLTKVFQKDQTAICLRLNIPSVVPVQTVFQQNKAI